MTPRVVAADSLPPVRFTGDEEHYLARGERQFERLGDGWYRFTVLEPGIQFEVDRLRLDKHQWIGELTVRCDLSGARMVGGELPPADFNFSSIQARQQRAKYLQDRAATREGEIDWLRLIEEFTAEVLRAERNGQPAALLRDLPIPPADGEWTVDGFPLLRDEPTIVFGDGGTTKSLLALYFLGVLAQRGMPTMLCDWEFSPTEHRRRLEALFGSDMPPVQYIRCERPLIAEADRIRRIIRQSGIRYAVLDSVGFACDGPPEASESAIAFQQAARTLGIGSLWTAHINRSESGDQRPFGSAFWYNAGRSIWNIKRVNESSVGSLVTVSLFHRKANTGRLRSALAYEIDFGSMGTTVRPTDITMIPEVASKLPLAQRVAAAVRTGPKLLATVATELAEDLETIRTTVKRRADRQKEFRYYDNDHGEKVVALLDWKYSK